jgi:hypothetical protein
LGEADRERIEWRRRQELSMALAELLPPPQAPHDPDGPAEAAVVELLDPYWGFGSFRTPKELRQLLGR